MTIGLILYTMLAYVGSFWFLRTIEEEDESTTISVLASIVFLASPVFFVAWIVIYLIYTSDDRPAKWGPNWFVALLTRRKIINPFRLLGRWVLGLPVRSPAVPSSPSGPPAPPEGA